MPISTTDSMAKVALRCRCGKLARGGILLGAEGLGECCASVADKALIRSMVGNAPVPVERPGNGGPEVSLVFALHLVDPSTHRATLTPNPKPPIAYVSEFIDRAPGESDPEGEVTPFVARPVGPVAGPAYGDPSWIGGRRVGRGH